MQIFPITDPSQDTQHNINSIPQNTHPLQTRSTSGIVQHGIHPTLLLAHMEPKSTKQALADPTWLASMKAEYDALIKNDTWSFVSLPPNRVPIGCRWGFRIKNK